MNSVPFGACAAKSGTLILQDGPAKRWFYEQDKTDLTERDGLQQGALEYPGLSKKEIFEAVERFYHRYHLCPKPILRIVKTILQDKDVCVRRLGEGCRFFKNMAQRRSDLKTAKATA